MSLVNETGLATMHYDAINFTNAAQVFNALGIIDASTEKVAFVGCVWHPTVKTGTINIRKVHFRCGAVTLNGASAFRTSLQNVSLTAGPPYQPDGTQDQTADLSALNANAWNTTGNLSADRAVDLGADSPGDANSRWLAVVFEYQTFNSGDSVVINGLTGAGAGRRNIGNSMLLNTGSWSILTAVSIVAFECDDGSFAFLRGCTPISAISSASVSSSAAIRRAGAKFRFPTERKISGFALNVNIPNNCDGRLVIYDSDGTTELASVDIDNDAVASANDGSFAEFDVGPITFAANTWYRLVFVGGTTTAGTVPYVEVNAAALMDGLMMGQDLHWTQHDGSNWADTTTRRPLAGFAFSAFHDGSGGGGINRAALPSGLSALG